ncbi:MAG: hypothetical protein WKF84_18590 [Pyrinomonadaceae bacterium]
MMKTTSGLLFILVLLVSARPVFGQQAPVSDAKPPAQNAVKTYKLGPDSLPQQGVPKGKLNGPFTFKSQIIAGTVRKYWVYVPTRAI